MQRDSRIRRAICHALKDSLVRTRPDSQGNLVSYGVRVPSFSRDLRQIDLALGYLAGEEYCCGQVSCSIPYYCQSWWRALRKRLARDGVELPPRAVFNVAVITEVGALFPVWGGEAREFNLRESVWRESESRPW